MPSVASPPLIHAPRVARPVADATRRRVLLACGIASSLVYVVANVAGGLVFDGYSFADQAISELAAIDAPSRPLWTALGIAYDVLLLAFAVGVWMSAGPRRRLRVVAGLLAAIAVIGSFWPPMHLRGTVTTLTDTLHVVFAAVISVLILLAIGIGAGAFGARFRRTSIASLVLLLVSGSLLFLLYAPRIADDLPTPGLGAIERVNLGLYLAWVVLLAVALLRESLRPRRKGAMP